MWRVSLFCLGVLAVAVGTAVVVVVVVGAIAVPSAKEDTFNGIPLDRTMTIKEASTATRRYEVAVWTVVALATTGPADEFARQHSLALSSCVKDQEIGPDLEMFPPTYQARMIEACATVEPLR